jgi:hypothetical protein
VRDGGAVHSAREVRYVCAGTARPLVQPKEKTTSVRLSSSDQRGSPSGSGHSAAHVCDRSQPVMAVLRDDHVDQRHAARGGDDDAKKEDEQPTVCRAHPAVEGPSS